MSTLADVMSHWGATPMLTTSLVPLALQAAPPPAPAGPSPAPAGSMDGVTLSATPSEATGSVASSASPTLPSSLAEQLKSAQDSISTLDPKASRWKAVGVLAAGGVGAVALGQLASALFPGGAALGVAFALSVGVSAVTQAALKQVVGDMRDPSMLVGTSVLTFFTGAAQPAVTAQIGPAAALAFSAGVVVLTACAFGRSLESDPTATTRRLEHARHLAEKYATYQEQHEKVVAGAG